MEADAQLARLLATLVRDEKVAEGVLLFFNEKHKIYLKENADRRKEQAKKEQEAKGKHKPMTWKDTMLSALGY